LGVSSFRFQVSSSEYFTLKIYDLHGREVATVVDRVFPAGEHEVRFDASGLPAGIYVLQVKDKYGSLVTGKFVKN
jgi:hypothetical protein